MAELVHGDVVEQILIGLDVKDLMSCKRVCKSWHSLITSPPFSNSYNNDRCNNQLGHRRIYSNDSGFKNHHHVVGSSNGLICIISRLIQNSSQVIVGNPLTGAARHLTLPPLNGSKLCWGFGYDSSTDDYKVIVGAHGNQTCFRVFSLKSNVWKVIGVVKYRWFSTVYGVLCNGALHWLVRDESYTKKLIISYDLSKEEFKETPQPEDAGDGVSRLGVMENCLCMYERSAPHGLRIWLMTKHNAWELLPRHRYGNPEKEYDLVHLLSPGLGCKDYDPLWSSRAVKFRCWEYMDAPIYVQSLVSPHLGLVREDPGASSSSCRRHIRIEKLVREHPGPRAALILMKKVICYTSIMFMSFMFLKSRLR